MLLKLLVKLAGQLTVVLQLYDDFVAVILLHALP